MPWPEMQSDCGRGGGGGDWQRGVVAVGVAVTSGAKGAYVGHDGASEQDLKNKLHCASLSPELHCITLFTHSARYGGRHARTTLRPTVDRVHKEHLDATTLRVLVLFDRNLHGDLVKHANLDMPRLWAAHLFRNRDLVRLGVVRIFALKGDEPFESESD